MPRLPSDEILGGLPSGNSGRPFVTGDLSAPGRAQSDLGQGIANLGKGIDQGISKVATVIQDEAKKRDILDEGNADSQRTIDRLKLQDQIDNETDPQKIDELKGQFKTIDEKYASAYKDPQRLAKTRQTWNVQTTSSELKADTRAQTLRDETTKADALNILEEQRRVGLEAKTPEARDEAIAAANKQLDRLREAGIIKTDGDLAKQKRDFAERFAIDKTNMLPATERVAALGGLPAALAARESGGNPTLVNQFGFAGLYQYGAPRLQTLGVYSPGGNEDLAGWNKAGRSAPGKWSGSFNIPGFPQVKTLQDFLASPDAQNAVQQIDNAKMDQEIDGAGLNRYVGQTIGGVPITRDGIKAMIHLGGLGGAKTVLESGGAQNPADANGTRLLSYAKMAGATDTPLTRIIPADRRQSMLETAKRQAEQDGNTERNNARVEASSVKLAVAEDEQSISQTGKPLDGLTTDRVRNALGEDEAQRFAINRDQAQRYYEKTNDFEQIPAEEINARLAAMDPRKNGEAGKPGFATASQWYDKAYERAKEVMKERNRDPAAAADRQPDVAQAKQGTDLNQPATYAPLVKRRMEAQARLGVTPDNRVPFTEQEAKAIFAPVARALPGEEKQALTDTVEMLKQVFGNDRDMIDRALEQGLKVSHVEKATREAAARILRKIGLGDTVDRRDAEAVSEGRKQDAQARAASTILNAVPPVGNPAGDGYGFTEDAPPPEQGPPAPRIPSMTRDELVQLWNMPSNKKMLEKYVETFGSDVVRRAMDARPKDWDPGLYQRHQSGQATAPKRQIQIGPGGIFDRLSQTRDAVAQ